MRQSLAIEPRYSQVRRDNLEAERDVEAGVRGDQGRDEEVIRPGEAIVINYYVDSLITRNM